jgi:type II secretory pathway component PulJ
MLTRCASERGVSIVELMVSIAVGMFLVMALTQFFVGHIVGNADLLKATRLNQELRAVMDLMVRDIRRTGYWGNAVSGVWYEGSPGVATNPLQSVTIGSTANPATATSGTSVTYSYDVNGNGTVEDSENFTIRLNNNAVELVQGITNPTTTTLSDTGTTRITALTFSFAPAAVNVTCVVAGPTPSLTIRELTISVAGQLTSDSTVTRAMQETVRIRADRIIGTCPAVVT